MKNAVVSKAILTLLSLLSWIQAEKQGCLQFCIMIYILSIWWRAVRSHSQEESSISYWFSLVWADKPATEVLGEVVEKCGVVQCL